MNITGIIPPLGAYPCKFRCGATLARPGACDACWAVEERKTRSEGTADALASLPAGFLRDGWARLGNPRLAAKIGAVNVQRAADALASPLAVATVITGGAGSGRTSLAVAMAQRLIAQGVRDGGEAYHVARGVRFVSAVALVGSRGDADEAVLETAKRATVLVLDDMGKELAGARGESGVAAQRALPTIELLDYRFNAGKPTIVTLAIPRESVQSVYGEGHARRPSIIFPSNNSIATF
jgi:hypothetical protein